MGLNRLFVKKFGNAITSQTKIAGRNIPEGAVTFDYVSGIGKKGAFQTYSFRNSKGKLIQRNTTYNNGGEKTYSQRTYNKLDGWTRQIFETVEDSSGNLLSDQSTIFQGVYADNQGRPFISQTIEKFGKDTDILSQYFLRPGKPKKGIKIETSYDGKVPNIEYINTNGSLPAQNLEYLPLTLSTSQKRTGARINHISKILEKLHDIEGVSTPVKRVKALKTTGYVKDAETDIYNGEIKILDNISLPLELLKILGHEFRHRKDFLDIFRLKGLPEICKNAEEEKILLENLKILEEKHPGFFNYVEKALQKTPIDANSQTGKFLQKIRQEADTVLYGNSKELYNASTEGHDSFIFERIANKARAREEKKYLKLCNTLGDILT